MRNTSAQRGFTILEMMAVVAIMAVLAVVAVSTFATLQRKGESSDAARQVASLVTKARVAGASGRSITPAPAPAPAPAPPAPGPGPAPAPAPAPVAAMPPINFGPATDRIRMTTVSVVSPTQLALRAIAMDGSVQTLEVVDIANDSASPLQIQEAVGSTMRFRRSGLKISGPNQFTLVGPSGVVKTITVSASGRIEIL